jgi:predicted metal-dependent hydrolase
MTTTTSAPMPRPRAVEFRFQDVPRYWFNGSPLATHLSNGVNLLFPAGERFFVRSVRHYMSVIDGDPVLREQVRGFFGQEGRHAKAHEDQVEFLEAQGFDVKGFLRVYEAIAFGFLERIMPPEVRLSATVAAEHFTAIMAENAFKLGLLEVAHPVMRDLLKWHAAEEIEHRSVAFDVLKRVNPSYALRMTGLAFTTVLLAGFWAAATVVLVAQDGTPLGDILGELKSIREDHPVGERVFARGIREYVRRDFHPSDNDNDGLASGYLESAGIA